MPIHDRGEFRQYGCYAHQGCVGSLMNWLLCLLRDHHRMGFRPEACASGTKGSWRASAGDRRFCRRQECAVGQFRYGCYSMVACDGVRRAGPSFPFGCSERGCLPEGWANGDGWSGCAHRDLDGWPAAAGLYFRRPPRPNHFTCRFTRRREVRLCVLGSRFESGRSLVTRSRCCQGIRRTSMASPSRQMDNRWSASVTILR